VPFRFSGRYEPPANLLGICQPRLYRLFWKRRDYLSSTFHLPLIPITRRRFLYGTAAAVAVVGGDSIAWEPNRPRIVRKDFLLPRWPERLNGFTIALLSDFHYDPAFSVHPLHASIPLVNALRPDLIALTGDFVSVPFFGNEKKAAADAEPCASLLRQMNAPCGLWAVLGNHDWNTDPGHVTRALAAEGIRVLANESVAIERDGSRFWLAGVNDVISRTADLKKTLHVVPAGESVVLLAHEPDFADHAALFPIDLQLSGHSHGGQVRIPMLPPLYLPDMAKKYVMGTYQIGPLILYTNAGLGTVDVPIRLNCPPEITLLTLRAGAKQPTTAFLEQI
jgi:predicted MPP superfamily phosphohydrolase